MTHRVYRQTVVRSIPQGQGIGYRDGRRLSLLASLLSTMYIRVLFVFWDSCVIGFLLEEFCLRCCYLFSSDCNSCFVVRVAILVSFRIFLALSR